jgi:signal peptidase I
MKPSHANNSHSTKAKSSLYSIKEEGISIVGKDLVDILRAVLDKSVPCRFRAPGFSMSPFIRNGDVITISRLSGDYPCLGKVVAFIHPTRGKLIVHRVVGREDGRYLIKGDNSPHADGLIPKENILGYVSKVERDGKRILLGLGPERLLIAFLSRRGLLLPLLCRVGWFVRPFIRRKYS